MRATIWIVLCASLAACGGNRRPSAVSSPSDVVMAAPSWYPSPPSSDGYLAASATADSPDLHLAMSRARMRARGEIAQTLELRFQGLLKSFAEQTGPGSDATVLNLFSETYRAVVNDVLTGTEVADSKVVPTRNGYIVFALVRLPLGEANKAFVQKARAREELWTQLRASKAFEELDAEIRKYEQGLRPPR